MFFLGLAFWVIFPILRHCRSILDQSPVMCAGWRVFLLALLVMRKYLLVGVAALSLPLAAQAADYTSVTEAVTAATGLPATATTAFLTAATLGVGVMIVRTVIKVVRKGISLG